MTVRGYVARKYIVNLKAAEHDQLHANIHKGEHSAQLIMKARILLKADCSEAGEAWTDRQILAPVGVWSFHGRLRPRQDSCGPRTLGPRGRRISWQRRAFAFAEILPLASPGVLRQAPK